MNQAAKDILQKVAGWPDEDQQELAELAREIEARRTGVYVLSEPEQAAIADARRGAFASDEDAAAFWTRHGLA
jgi:site-specific DNA-adenine methylase